MTSASPDVLPPEDGPTLPTAVGAPRDALTEFGKIDIGLERAAEIANQLSAVIKKSGLAAQISGKKHLLVEAWQTCGMMAGVSAKTEWTKEARDPVGGTLDGYDARVQVIRMATGQVIGAAESSCHFDEQLKHRKTGELFDRWMEHGRPNRHACKSMAQTRATSKALAQVLRWIPVLAGYSGTPYEEMPEAAKSEPPPFQKREDPEEPPLPGDQDAPPRSSPVPSTEMVTRKAIFHANFKRSEEVHGPSDDTKIKFAPLNWATRQMGHERFDDVPERELEELASLIAEYTAPQPAASHDVPF